MRIQSNTFKQGATFAYAGFIVNLPDGNWQPSATLRTSDGTFIQDLAIALTPPSAALLLPPGLNTATFDSQLLNSPLWTQSTNTWIVILYASYIETALWPLGPNLYDIRLNLNGNVIISPTQTVNVITAETLS